MELVEYLIDNIYINVGNRVFRQRVGILMDTDCAPLLANLFLFYYEYLYMKGLMKITLHWQRGLILQGGTLTMY